jgi:diadenosine tetraphosphate (Ap4A) HIT family hydrolase
VFERSKIDVEAYNRRAQSGPCFICGIIARNPEFPAHIIFEDDVAIAMLDRYPVLYGHTLVAPREHREQVTGDFTLQAYLDLQERVYVVAEAVRLEVGAERVYINAFGSNQGNAHVHWHIVPLPPGVPYREQQLAAVSQDPLRIPDADMAALAAGLRRRLEAPGGT